MIITITIDITINIIVTTKFSGIEWYIKGHGVHRRKSPLRLPHQCNSLQYSQAGGGWISTMMIFDDDDDLNENDVDDDSTNQVYNLSKLTDWRTAYGIGKYNEKNTYNMY